jgi:hypothetical protein
LNAEPARILCAALSRQLQETSLHEKIACCLDRGPVRRRRNGPGHSRNPGNACDTRHAFHGGHAFDRRDARRKLIAAQLPLLDRLEAAL